MGFTRSILFTVFTVFSFSTFAAAKKSCASQLVEWGGEKNAKIVESRLKRLSGKKEIFLVLTEKVFGDYVDPKSPLPKNQAALFLDFLSLNKFSVSVSGLYSLNRTLVKILKIQIPTENFNANLLKFREEVKNNNAVIFVGAKLPQLAPDTSKLYADLPADKTWDDVDSRMWIEFKKNELLIGKMILTRGNNKSEIDQAKAALKDLGIEVLEINDKDLAPMPPGSRIRFNSAWIKTRAKKSQFDEATLKVPGLYVIGLQKP